MKSFVKSLTGALLALVVCGSPVFASADNVQLVNDVLQQSGLKEKMLKENFGDVVSLENTLIKAVWVNGDAKDYLEAVRNAILPAISKTKNKALKDHQYSVVQYNILFIAGENGY